MNNDLTKLCERDHHFIGGQWIEGTADPITLIDPYTQQAFGRAPSADNAIVDMAVNAAQQALSLIHI
jgi:acyl-CoA reductase-like NAD-dependent aldehyde dehydrogenase